MLYLEKLDEWCDMWSYIVYVEIYSMFSIFYDAFYVFWSFVPDFIKKKLDFDYLVTEPAHWS